MTERTFLFLGGLLQLDQTAEWPAVPYARTATEVLLIANGLTPSDASGAKIKLTLADVAQTQEFALAQGLKRQVTNVTGDGLAIAADVRPGVKVTAHGSASDLVVWLTCESTTSNDTETGWLILTAGMLQSRISAPEYNALTAAVISSGQSDPIPQLLSDVTERVRLAIRSGGETLGAVNTIPASLRRAALAIAKHDLFSRIAVLRTLAEGAKNDAEKAERMLERVEEGKVKIEAPATDTETETGNAAEYGSETKIDL
jgi:hypothetical protein